MGTSTSAGTSAGAGERLAAEFGRLLYATGRDADWAMERQAEAERRAAVAAVAEAQAAATAMLAVWAALVDAARAAGVDPDAAKAAFERASLTPPLD